MVLVDNLIHGERPATEFLARLAVAEDVFGSGDFCRPGATATVAFSVEGSWTWSWPLGWWAK